MVGHSSIDLYCTINRVLVHLDIPVLPHFIELVRVYLDGVSSFPLFVFIDK